MRIPVNVNTADRLMPPSTVDYNLWLGPAKDEPIMRPKFHYDWHRLHNIGAGDMGIQGAHELASPPPARDSSCRIFHDFENVDPFWHG